MLPLSAWGTNAVLAHYAYRQNCLNNDVVWRIMAGADDMEITFDPPAPPPYNSSYTFATQGETISFVSDQDHYAESDSSFFAYQMMTSATYAMCDGDDGDPFMLQVPPAGQFLDRYVFLTDDVFDFNYDSIIVVREAGTVVELDCLGVIPEDEYTQVGSTNWETARIFLDIPGDSPPCGDGPHTVTASNPIGLSVVGTDIRNSYGYLGGTGVRNINPDVQ